jgi:hypothetical protein
MRGYEKVAEGTADPNNMVPSDVKFKMDGDAVVGYQFLDIDREPTTDARMTCWMIVQRVRDGMFTTLPFTWAAVHLGG